MNTNQHLTEMRRKMSVLDSAVTLCSLRNRFDMAQIWRKHRDDLTQKYNKKLSEFYTMRAE